MDYHKHYSLLICRAKNRVIEGYTETHHIVPRCMGGDDSSTNLVKLTPEEHYLAHLLLCKCHPGNKKLLFAARMMTVDSGTAARSNKQYGWLRRAISESMKGEGNHMFGRIMSDERKKLSSHPGESNPFFGKNHTAESKSLISVKNKGKPGLHGPLNGMYERTHSAETKKKISDNNPYKGTAGLGTHPNCGRIMAEEQKEYYRQLFSGRKVPDHLLDKWRKPKGPQLTVECPHCGKTGGESNMKRYHFENCKNINEKLS